MNLAEYTVLFALVAIIEAGLPGPGDAALIAAGTLAGEGRASLGIVLATAMGAWMLGSLIGFEIGVRKGRWLLEHPGRLEKARRKMLTKGDSAFSRNYFVASVTMRPSYPGFFGCNSTYSRWGRSSPVSAGSACTWGFRISWARRSRSGSDAPGPGYFSVCS